MWREIDINPWENIALWGFGLERVTCDLCIIWFEIKRLMFQIIVGVKKIRISVNGLLGDTLTPYYRHSFDNLEELLVILSRICLGHGGFLSKLLCTQGQTVS